MFGRNLTEYQRAERKFVLSLGNQGRLRLGEDLMSFLFSLGQFSMSVGALKVDDNFEFPNNTPTGSSVSTGGHFE